ncbi:Uncharacterised protein [Mycobacteroides abscessus subsp. abscessus]|nr:Uncharacterised protein [Mycobacteroides abscessus subsp. abscessus]
MPKVGRDQNFYTLGGDSLLLSQMVGKLRDRVPEVADIEWQELLRDVLRNPTVAALAARRTPREPGCWCMAAPARSRPTTRCSRICAPRTPGPCSGSSSPTRRSTRHCPRTR